MAVESAALPGVGLGDVLVEVRAAGITPSELGWEPTWTNADGSERTPTIPSHEVTGTVVLAGAEVDELRVGARVFGLTDFFRDGGAAEYVAVRAADVATCPPGLGAEAAAALPLSGLTAWQALFDHGHLLADQRVLVHGAAGGVSTFVVQLAHHTRAHVTAVVSTRDIEYVRDLGADMVIDRQTSAFDRVLAEVDLIVDTVGGDVLERSWSVLAPNGRLVSVVPSSREIAARDPRGHFFGIPSDSWSKGLAGQWPGDQSPSGSVVCPTSIR